MRILYCLLVCFVLWQASSFAQTSLLEKYHFEEGGYYLVGLQTMEGGENAFADSTKEFYIDDLKTMQAIKKEWVFTKPSPQYACGYHYEVFVCKNGVGLESFNINLNCNLITSDKGYFYFEVKKLIDYRYNFKKVRRELINLNSLPIQEAKVRKQILCEKPDILFVEATTLWEQYEGNFQFRYTSTEKGALRQKKEVLEKIKAEIEKKYPNEVFDLNDVESSADYMIISINCSKNLSKTFNLYKKTERWKAHEKYIICYWAK